MIFVPWRTALDFGGFISSISLVPKHNVSWAEYEKIGEALALPTRTNVYVGYNGKVFNMVAIFSYIIQGWELVMPSIVVLSALNIVSAMMSSVYQRRRDIMIYTAVGLSPMGALLMFLAEALTFALVSVVLGYLLGYALNGLFVYYGLLPKTFSFNFTSAFVVVSLLVTITSCMVAALYPSYIASKMIVPSLERKWKLPTKPKGDLWDIPLPSRILDKNEVLAILKYLKEYYEGEGAERPGYLISEINELNLSSGYLKLKVAFTPLELGTYQEATIYAIFNESEKVFNFFVTLKRLSGDYQLWLSRSYQFVDDVRKQLLLWGSLPLEERKKYF